jgi:hypothetical protein
MPGLHVHLLPESQVRTCRWPRSHRYVVPLECSQGRYSTARNHPIQHSAYSQGSLVCSLPLTRELGMVFEEHSRPFPLREICISDGVTLAAAMRRRCLTSGSNGCILCSSVSPPACSTRARMSYVKVHLKSVTWDHSPSIQYPLLTAEFSSLSNFVFQK